MALLNYYFQGVCAISLLRVCSGLSLVELVFGLKLGSERPRSYDVVEYDAERLTREAGYPLEEHEVSTEDGYILKAHRLPYGRKTLSKKNRPPVLLQHGLLTTSEAWMMFDANTSLAYVLADAGYDVWLLNLRGNFYSRKHKTLNPNTDAQFWNFSMHEYGYYDLASGIDYVLNVTNETKLYFIGHSMGCTVGLILCSTRPEYNEKIRLHINFAPMAFIKHEFSPFLILFTSIGLPTEVNLMTAAGIYEAFPRRLYNSEIVEAMCNDLPDLCLAVIFVLCGIDPSLTASSPIVFSRYFPAGTSRNVIFHQYYLLSSGKFANIPEDMTSLYDKQKEYNVSQITAPVAIYHGAADYLIRPEDVKYLVDKLPNVASVAQVPYDGFNHVDFIFPAAKIYLHRNLLRLMKKYRSKSVK